MMTDLPQTHASSSNSNLQRLQSCSYLKCMGLHYIRTLIACRLCRKVAATVFFAILAVEAVILVISVQNYKDMRLTQIETKGLALLQTLTSLPYGNEKILEDHLSVLLEKGFVRGLKIDGMLSIEVGETRALPEGESRYLANEGTRFIRSWTPQELGTDYSATLVMDTSELNGLIANYILRITGLVFIITTFVTLVLMPVLGRAVLMPILHLRQQLAAAGADPIHPEKYKIYTEIKNELGDVIVAFNLMLERMSHGLEEIQAQQASLLEAKNSLEQRVEERTKDLRDANLTLRREISNREQAEQELTRLSSLPGESLHPVVRLNADNEVIYANAAGYALLSEWGVETLKVDNDTEHAIASELKPIIAELRGSSRQGHMEVTCHHSLFAIRMFQGPDGEVTLYGRDISDQKAAEAQLQHLSNHDALTGLANRSLLLDRLDQTIKRNPTADSPAALHMIDLRGFKEINDAHGHDIGDQVLQEVGESLKKLAHPRDTVARFAGDEFAFIQAQPGDGDGAAALGEEILKAISEERLIKGLKMSLRANVGIALYPGDGETGEDLIRNAGLATGRAKLEEAQHPRLFVHSMNEEIQQRRALESALRDALRHQEFELHYQPKLDLRNKQVKSAEALLRWHHPERGFIPPDQFIPLAERSGLILPIGAWVLEEAIRQAKIWSDGGHPIKVAVNLSPLQFKDQPLPELVGSLLRKHGLSPELLELEITETVLMTDAESTANMLMALHRLGIALSIDDFGTGYSSLSYLRAFPVQRVKIDRAFVKDITGDKPKRTNNSKQSSQPTTGAPELEAVSLPQEEDPGVIARSVTALSHNLGLSVTAEGVETAEQLQYLLDHGCDEIQGYLVSKPVPAQQFLPAIAEENIKQLFTKSKKRWSFRK